MYLLIKALLAWLCINCTVITDGQVVVCLKCTHNTEIPVHRWYVIHYTVLKLEQALHHYYIIPYICDPCGHCVQSTPYTGNKSGQFDNPYTGTDNCTSL